MQRATVERALKAPAGPRESANPDEYRLRLYVAGTSSRSRQAIVRARELCDGELSGRCTLEVIDIYQDPLRARDDQIFATPTLVRESPLPLRRLIGTLASSGRLLVGPGLDAIGASAS
jgi:circadian clock protein KaiB